MKKLSQKDLEALTQEKGTNRPREKKKHTKPANNLYKWDPTYFRPQEQQPALFHVDVPLDDYEHLLKDDLDPVSKMEVTYKVLKNQLRQH